jgi:hypothetical protein
MAGTAGTVAATPMPVHLSGRQCDLIVPVVRDPRQADGLACIYCGLADGPLFPIGHLAVDAEAMLFAHPDCIRPPRCHCAERRSRP